MEYKNIRTGAVINSPCVISGDDWILVGENEKDLSVTEIKKKLDELGIDYPPKAKKHELVELLGE